MASFSSASHTTSMQIKTPHGDTYIGARNSSNSHYEAQGGQHYFYGNVRAAGSITGNTASDIRLKTFITPIKNAIESINKLSTSEYLKEERDPSASFIVTTR